MNDILIKANGLTKQYHINSEKGSSQPTVLKALDFEVKRGEKWGIIGKNGSGKSTLLKILSGIIKPTSGSVTLLGSVAHILGVGDNFIPDLSGRENVEMFFRLHGFSAHEAADAFKRAAEFAGIGDYVYAPTKTYSDGMYLRLAFSACLQLSADVLLLDEVLSAGDISFQEKLKEHFATKFSSAETLVMVSHNPEEIIAHCTHCLWLDQGNIKQVGTAKDVESAYYYSVNKEKWEEDYKRPLMQTVKNSEPHFNKVENEYMMVNDFRVESPDGRGPITYESGVKFSIYFEKRQASLLLHPAIRVYNYLMNMILMVVPQANSEADQNLRANKDITGSVRIDAILPPQILTFGNYYAEIIFSKNPVVGSGFLEEAIKVPSKIHFEVKQGLIYDYAGGTDNISVKPKCNWELTIIADVERSDN